MGKGLQILRGHKAQQDGGAFPPLRGDVNGAPAVVGGEKEVFLFRGSGAEGVLLGGCKGLQVENVFLVIRLKMWMMLKRGPVL